VGTGPFYLTTSGGGGVDDRWVIFFDLCACVCLFKRKQRRAGILDRRCSPHPASIIECDDDVNTFVLCLDCLHSTADNGLCLIGGLLVDNELCDGLCLISLSNICFLSFTDDDDDDDDIIVGNIGDVLYGHVTFDSSFSMRVSSC
jgi:hypothetical protein